MATDCREEQVGAPSAAELAWCVDCRTALAGEERCLGCGRASATVEGILEAIGPLEGRNRTAAAFYEGPGWLRFRKWERLFLMLQGGARRARMSILRHLGVLKGTGARVLEVGIGDGENLPLLPRSWTLYGVDIARARLAACVRRSPAMAGRLARAEAERLPFPDATFDACYSIGGFTYYRDHAAALAEMRRVTRDGGPVVVADETPGMHRAGIGHLLGRPAIDKLWLRGLGLDADFVEMVLSFDVNLLAVTGRVWPDAARIPIWCGLGYCLVEPASLAISPGRSNARARSIS